MSEIDRITPTQRPAGRAAGSQRWLELSFLHWRVPADVLRPLIPGELTVDECDGSAWVALVPFRMEGVRPWWSPSVPGVSNFAETNVRTYVHHEGREPGVWFFSLEAANRLAVWVARNFWHLNYQFASMKLTRENDRIRYESSRHWPENTGVGGRVEVTIGDPIEQDGPGGPGTAEPGTLEHFLGERYVLYTKHPRGHLIRGRVHHVPYPLKQATSESIEDTLVPAAGIDVAGRPPDHVLFSEGVHVNVFPLERV